MHKRLMLAIVCSAVISISAFGVDLPTSNYSLTLAQNRTNWTGEEGDDLSITIRTFGVEYGNAPIEGLGFVWSGTFLFPLSLSYNIGGELVTYDMTGFGFGMMFQLGAGYAIDLTERVRVMPGLGWNFTLSFFPHDFPGGATSYQEVTHGPALVGEVAYKLFDVFWLRAGATLAYEGFQSASQSNVTDTYRGGFVFRAAIGVRAPRIRRIL
ncbi:MAG: hypothetical protein EA426_05265 [Spirochaetaceae bacterium]|nr:MAG: hypothetical protein EA426_05265 [Spirochaetaceae bacterium]